MTGKNERIGKVKKNTGGKKNPERGPTTRVGKRRETSSLSLNLQRSGFRLLLKKIFERERSCKFDHKGATAGEGVNEFAGYDGYST